MNWKNHTFTLKLIKECIEDNILPLIVVAKTTKDTWDIFERNFGVWGSNKVEYEEFGESRYS